jgi:glutamine synthetase
VTRDQSRVEPGDELGQPARDFDTYLVAVPDLAGRLVGKRVDGEFYRDHAVGGVRTCDVIFGWGIGHELLAGFPGIGWDHGYGDFVAVPDAATMRPLAWWPRTALVFGDAVRDDGSPVDVAPRQVLADQLERAEALGYSVVAASELEFTVFEETPRSLEDKGYARLAPHGAVLHPELLESTGLDGRLLTRLCGSLRRSGIPVESIKAEYSLGQYELVMSAAAAMAAADNHAVYKLGAREIFRGAGLAASFMAKWDEGHGGSSCHIHVSLVDKVGCNLFGVGDDRALRHFIGGIEHYARDVFLLWAQYPNSYKRFVPDTFAPSAFSWGTDNRTAALRIAGAGTSRHLENRIPGADVNPYLAYSGLIAAGLAGIEEQREPSDGVGNANAYAQAGLSALPRTLAEAIDAFASSKFARERFTSQVVDHIANFSAKELDSSRLAVTDWDRRRLFDI